MAHIREQKKLLSADLKSLIIHLTGFQEESEDYKACEETFWSYIIDRYHPSINEQVVKSKLLDFVEKFKLHGFPQKAKNLSTLINEYVDHPYFKKFSNSQAQWTIIELLVQLSYRPTSAAEDDDPIDLNKNVPEEDTFDWGAYLKEGNEKFRLPPEEEQSLSDWSDDEVSDSPLPPDVVPEATSEVQETSLNRIYMPPREVLEERERIRREEQVAALRKQLALDMWWENPDLREVPASEHPEANYCFIWETRNARPNSTRIVSEHKVVLELIYMLGLPSECYFIEKTSAHSWRVTANTSVSTLSPDVFAATIEQHFCRHFPNITKLQSFINETQSHCFPSPSFPISYSTYGLRLQKIMYKYYKELEELERLGNGLETAVTLRYLLARISPYLIQIEYLTKLHETAVPKDWQSIDARTNSFRLISVLYDEVKESKLWRCTSTEWLARNLLLLFLDSVGPFLCQLGQIMAFSHTPAEDEFFLSSYGGVLVPWEPSTREFWEPVLKTASSAIASSTFLFQLGRTSSFYENSYPPDILLKKTIEKLSEEILVENIDIRAELENKKWWNNNGSLADNIKHLFDAKNSNTFSNFKLTSPPMCLNSFTDIFSSVILDRIDLSTCPLQISLKNCIVSTIEEYMEPTGFAEDILLKESGLLHHLRALYLTTTLLSTVLASNSFSLEAWNKINVDFEDCLKDIVAPEYIENFQLTFDKSCITNKKNILQLPDHLRLSYRPSTHISPVISPEALDGYSKIFSFLIKVRMALTTLNRLIFKRIEETEANCLRLRRLYTIRTWFLHALNALNMYFFTYTDADFQLQMKSICLNERKLCSIEKAHMEFINNWKNHCFLIEGHPCLEYITEILSLTLRLELYWKMEQKEMLADYHLDDLEILYSETIISLAQSLRLFEDRLIDSNDTFSFLYDEITNNIPGL